MQTILETENSRKKSQMEWIFENVGTVYLS